MVGRTRPSRRTQELSEQVAKAASSARASSRKPTSTLDQLRLSHLKLHGRDEDIKLLKTKLNDLVESVSTDRAALPEIVMVSGVSGTGKSALVKRGLEEPAKRMGVAYAAGKFDLNNTPLPLSAFSAAMTSLAKYVLSHENVDAVRDNIKETFVKEDVKLLARSLPGCSRLLGVDQSESTISTAEGISFGKEATARQQYAISRLLKIICSHVNAVIIFIDDLQWSDTATLDILRRISLDNDIQGLLITGAYREDEVSESHPLALQLREKQQKGITITKVSIGNLSVTNVQSLIAEALGMEGDEEMVGSLSQIVHSKTNGNAFFVLMFLRSLHDEELLKYNFGLMRWLWKDEEIKAKLATENVATIMVDRLKRMNGGLQRVLMISSCLGSTFSRSIVATVYQATPPEGTSLEDDTESDTKSIVSDSAKELQNEGLWEVNNDSAEIASFSHDKVQSAAFDLIPERERDLFRAAIGDVLLSKLDPKALDENLSVAVSLRNCGIALITDEKERKALSVMNLGAGMKACSSAAFDSAVAYFKAGRELLGDNAWEVDNDVMLKLCSEEANACFINGDFDAMNYLVEQVLGREELSIKDKFKAYEVKVLAAMAKGNFTEAVETALLVRKLLGLTTMRNKPASMVTILRSYLKTRRAVKKHTIKTITNLPKLKDERVVMGQRMLETLLESTIMVQPTIYPLVSLLLVRTSLKHGINASSCDGFTTFGMLLSHAFNDLRMGCEMAKTSEAILERPDVESRMKSRVVLQVEGFIYWWLSPVQNSLGPLLNGYQVGLELGDLGSASYNLLFRTTGHWASGFPLQSLLSELETTLTVLERLNQTVQRLSVTVYYLAANQLRGTKVDDISFTAILKVAEDTPNFMLRSYVYTARLELLAFQQDWESAADLLSEAGDCARSLPDIIHTRFTFMEALISIRKAHSAKGFVEKSKWKIKGLKSYKQIESWVKQGCPNLVHVMHLLRGEISSLKGKGKKAQESYNLAITAARRAGFRNDLGLIHEIAGRYYSSKGDTSWAKYHLEKAEESYADWGATAKVHILQQDRKELIG